MTAIKVQARDLKPGDRLAMGSKSTVKRVSRGVGTPSGKYDIDLEGGSGDRRATWNARTEILVYRAEA